MCVAALLAAAAGCGDGTGPGLPPRYELATLEGKPLPTPVTRVYVASTTPGEADVWCEVSLTSARITFGSGGRYTATNITLRACADGRPDLASTLTEDGTFTLGDSGSVSMRAGERTMNGTSEHVWYATRVGRELRVTGQSFGSSGYGAFLLDMRSYVYRAVP